MRQKHFVVLSPHGFHRAAYTEWGDPANGRVAICVHGLTRNSRDFDYLARALEQDYRVICADVLGRGKSDWLSHKVDYGYPLYISQMAALIAHLDVEAVDWIGTSMGGLIGMMIAALPGNPIRRLVMNDVGPFLPQAASERLAQYVGEDRTFDNVDAVEHYLRKVLAPFGPLTDTQWRNMAEHGHYRDSGGKLHLAYDPAIGAPFRGQQRDIDLWPVWNAVRCPVLVIRGAQSDLLLAETVAQMKVRPDTTAVEIAGVGHAPMLINIEQTDLVRDFLLR